MKPYVPSGRTERRSAERRAAPREGHAQERRTGRDRRRRSASLFNPGLELGWLCFENRAEKRRLTPIPSGWQEAPEPELEELLEHARRVPRRLSPPDETES